MEENKITATYKPLFKYDGEKGLVERNKRKIDIGNTCEYCNKEKRTLNALCYKCRKFT